jgi:hypothetical protein
MEEKLVRSYKRADLAEKREHFASIGARLPYDFYHRVKETIRASSRNRSIDRIDIDSLTIMRIFDRDNYSCHYCSINLDDHIKRTGERLTIDRKDSELEYSEENCVVCCRFCNQLKGNVLNGDEAKIVCPIVRQAFERMYKKYKRRAKDIKIVVQNDRLAMHIIN